MSKESRSPAGVKFVLLVLALTGVAIGATAAVAYIFSSPPRGTMFWFVTVFLCAVEFLAGILAVNILALSRAKYRPSGAILAITYVMVLLYAASGLIATVVYLALRSKSGSGDGKFLAVFLLITLLWFIIVAVLYAQDLFSQDTTRAVTEKRADHDRRARSLKTTLSKIRAVRTDDDNLRARLAVLAKRLEGAETALAHSHGGGVGSWETGKAHPLSPEDDKVLAECIDNIGEIADRIPLRDLEEVGAAISEMETCATRLSSKVDALDLA